MSTVTASEHHGPLRALRLPATGAAAVGGWRLALAVAASRVIVVAAGATAALTAPRAAAWTAFDPDRLSARLGSVGNVLGASAVRWDAIHYLEIAHNGYATRTSAAFFPLYPLLIHGLGVLIGSDVVAATCIAYAGLITGLWLLERLTKLELGRRAAAATTLLLAFVPTSLFLSALYTESLFLALAAGAFYAARRERWVIAGALAALAALTRVSGVLLVPALAAMALSAPSPWFGATSVRAGGAWSRLRWLGIAPAALAAWLASLAARGFGWFAPFTAQLSPEHGHVAGEPVGTLVLALRASASGLGALARGSSPVYGPRLGQGLSWPAQSVLLLGILILALVGLHAVRHRLAPAYGIYAAGAILVCLWSPVATQPLLSLDRYVLTIFPLWMVAGEWLERRRLTTAATLVCAPLLALWAYRFGSWSFVA